MLNYIWGGLIVFSLVFALASDIRDFAADAYRNGQGLPVVVSFDKGYASDVRRQDVSLVLDSTVFQDFFDSSDSPAARYDGVLIQTERGRQLRFADGEALPEPLSTIRSATSRRSDDIAGELLGAQPPHGSEQWSTELQFEPVRWVKLNAIAQAAIDFAETAVTIALGLIGALALWLGLLKIAEASGILHSLVRLTQPLLRPLFPEVPNGHPAFGFIVLNLTANMLGLGNAATPLGIKAMQELQTLNPKPDTATNSMVMLLAMNTASVQIVPPVLLVAIMGLHVNQLFFSILITTALSLAVAITAAKLLGRLRRYRASDPGPVK